MEEILASIRRIIADDDQEPVRRPTRRDEAPRPEAGRVDAARPAPPRVDSARPPISEQRAFAPRSEAPRADVMPADGGLDGARPDAPRAAPARPPEMRRPEVAMAETARPVPRPEPLRAEPVRTEAVRMEPPHSEPVRYGTQRIESQQFSGPDAARPAPRPDLGRFDVAKPDGARRENVRAEHGPADGQGPQAARPDVIYTAAERISTEPQFRQDEHLSSGHNGETVARGRERDDVAVVAAPAVLRAAEVAEVSRPVMRAASDARAARPAMTADVRRKDLLSPAVDAAVMAAFESLGDVSLGQTALPEQGRTVEDLIKEILRPMLKTWLDDHLPDIVERLVRAEIERVARNGR